MNAHIARLNQQLVYLIEQGVSTDEALDKVNQSQFAKKHNIRLNQGQDAVLNVEQTEKNYQSLTPVLQENLATIAKDPRAFVAENILAEQKLLVQIGWKTFRNSAFSNLIYLVLLTLLTLLFQWQLSPSFLSLYAENGSHLPGLTQFAMGSGGLILLTVLWLICFTYLMLLTSVSNSVNRFQFLPNLMTHLPIFKQFKQHIDQIILFSVAEFVGRTTHHHFPSYERWQQWFPQHNDEQLHDSHQLTELSLELNSFETTMQKHKAQLNDHYMTLTTNAIKSVTLTLSILLGICIGLMVIAMYLPIFSLGSIL